MARRLSGSRSVVPSAIVAEAVAFDLLKSSAREAETHSQRSRRMIAASSGLWTIEPPNRRLGQFRLALVKYP